MDQIMFTQSIEKAIKDSETDPGAGLVVLGKNLDEQLLSTVVLVRGKLRVGAGALTDEQLKAVWRAMDAESAGSISIGDFGLFMRKGARDDAATAPSEDT